MERKQLYRCFPDSILYLHDVGGGEKLAVWIKLCNGGADSRVVQHEVVSQGLIVFLIVIDSGCCCTVVGPLSIPVA